MTKKQNQNSDGTNVNLIWNGVAEVHSTKPEVESLHIRQIKKVFCADFAFCRLSGVADGRRSETHAAMQQPCILFGQRSELVRLGPMQTERALVLFTS
jgi:hypothetical protein